MEKKLQRVGPALIVPPKPSLASETLDLSNLDPRLVAILAGATGAGPLVTQALAQGISPADIPAPFYQFDRLFSLCQAAQVFVRDGDGYRRASFDQARELLNAHEPIYLVTQTRREIREVRMQRSSISEHRTVYQSMFEGVALVDKGKYVDETTYNKQRNMSFRAAPVRTWIGIMGETPDASKGMSGVEYLPASGNVSVDLVYERTYQIELLRQYGHPRAPSIEWSKERTEERRELEWIA
jgi:hypothetical protein